MIKLTLTEKGGEPKLLTFDKDEVTLGRVSGNDIVLAKGNVSKRHSKLSLRNGQVEVSDLKSTNGTYVNGRKITAPMVLGPSDRVYVGDYLIGIEGLPGAAADGADDGDGPPTLGPSASGSRRAVAPPPPPPPRAGSSAARLPAYGEDEPSNSEEDLALAAHPPRSGRFPIPPPPPPPPSRRGPTPLGNRALPEEVFGDEGRASGPNPVPTDEDTGSAGLFAHTRAPDEEADGASRRVPTGNRPGVAAAAPAPTPAFVGERAATGPAVVAEASGAPGLEALLADPTVLQILITGPDAALVDRGSGLAAHPDSLGDPGAVADALWRYANTAFPPPAPDNPVVDVRLPDGTRVAAAFPPTAPAGVVAAIRRSIAPDTALASLIAAGGNDMQSVFEAAIVTRRNLLLTGDVAAMPHVLGALAGVIPPDRRVLSIGAGTPRGRAGWTDFAPAADAAGLLRVASTLRPDHLVVGEIAGPEVAEVLLLATRGQQGLIVAVPGRTPNEVLLRLAALAAAGLAAPPAAAASLLAGTFDLVVHAVAGAHAAARIVEVAEPRAAGAEVVTDVAYSDYGDARREAGDANAHAHARGVSARLAAAFAAAGSPLPAPPAAS